MSTPEPEPFSQTLASPPSVPPLDESQTLETPPEPSRTLESPLSVPPSDQTAYQPSAAPVVHPTAGQPSASPTDLNYGAAATGEGGTIAQAAPSAAAMVSGPTVVRIPGYEILGELGRGGMGVVYKVRQLGLNRLVAVKMILSGDYAAAGDLARFRLEAEAVAKLQHPNIVGVYEIDEVDGKPYFCLEFVNGGPLQKKFSGDPQPPLEAARLLEKLAGAMAYAHHHHIVHRDLKPANVLLTETGRRKWPTSAWPKGWTNNRKVKRRAAPSWGRPATWRRNRCTATPVTSAPAPTSIRSAPSSMKRWWDGRRSKARPSSTRWKWCARRNPWRRRAATQGAARSGNDLSQCLQKDPKNRYHSADDLAEDLRRFQAREPILARPTPAWERAWKWARCRPLAAALIGVSVLFALSIAVGGVAFGKYEQARAVEMGG